MERNPYAISFGRIPEQFIARSLIIDSIVETLYSDVPTDMAIKLTGVRGSGKTVTLTAIEQQMRKDKDWIVVGLRSETNILEDLIANLYSAVPFVTEFVDSNLNLSKWGIGLSLSSKSPVASLDFALKTILKTIDKRGKRVLITIDEVRKNPHMIDFIQEYQLLIRDNLPVYLIAAGLYEDVESLENADGLTFFLRAEKYEMTPLNLTIIRCDYEKTLGVARDVAEQMATLTKGYPFAYQALGKYMWASKDRQLDEIVLAQFDEALAEKVYNRIWSELSNKDKWYLSFIVKKEKMSATELLEITKSTHSEWSEPRRRLAAKGIIDTRTRGMISLRLPRFAEYVNWMCEEEGNA